MPNNYLVLSLKEMKTKKITKKSVEKKYTLEMVFNGETFSVLTDNIKKSILKLKPEILYTEVYIKIIKGEYVFERKLDLKRGKNLFINEDFLNVFVVNLNI